MNEYELMLLTGADLDDAARGAILDRLKETITKGGGTFESIDDWGRRKLQYEIQKQGEAHYSLVYFATDGSGLDEVVRILRITDGVMRVMPVTRIAARPEGVPLELVTEEEAEESARGRGGRGGRGGGGGGGGGRGGRERERA